MSGRQAPTKNISTGHVRGWGYPVATTRQAAKKKNEKVGNGWVSKMYRFHPSQKSADLFHHFFREMT